MFLLSFLPVFDISHLAKGSLPLWAWASAAFALWSTYRILWVEACLVFVTGSPSLFHRLAPLLLRLLQGRLLPLHTTGSAEQKSHIHETKCYLFHRITLQKQRQLSEAASTSLGTEAIWTKTGISGLLGDQMMSYYPPGNFCSCAYVSAPEWTCCSRYKCLLYVSPPATESDRLRWRVPWLSIPR